MNEPSTGGEGGGKGRAHLDEHDLPAQVGVVVQQALEGGQLELDAFEDVHVVDAHLDTSKSTARRAEAKASLLDQPGQGHAEQAGQHGRLRCTCKVSKQMFAALTSTVRPRNWARSSPRRHLNSSQAKPSR